MAPAVGFEPTTNGLTVRCATAAPRRINRAGGAYSKPPSRAKAPPPARWRSGAELNRRRGFCRPLPDHSATGPPTGTPNDGGGAVYRATPPPGQAARGQGAPAGVPRAPTL